MLIMAIIGTTIIPVFATGTNRTLNAYFNNIKLVVNGELITPRDANGRVVEPFIIDGATYLPVKAIIDAFGTTGEWDGATSTVYIGSRPGSTQYMFDVVPAYQSFGYTEISSIRSGGRESFNMAGQRFVNGCYWRTAWTNDEYYSIYNLNGKHKRASAVLGHVDGSGTGGATIYIYGDGRLIREYSLTANMPLTNINELYKRELLTERELDRCIQILTDKWKEENETCSGCIIGG